MARDFSDLKSGDELHPFHINEIHRELRRWRLASGDGDIIVDRANSTTVPPIFRAVSSKIRLRPGKVGGSDIASGSLTAPGSGDVTPYVRDPSGAGKLMADPAGAITAYNVWGTAVTANKACWLASFGGYSYIVIWDC